MKSKIRPKKIKTNLKNMKRHFKINDIRYVVFIDFKKLIIANA